MFRAQRSVIELWRSRRACSNSQAATRGRNGRSASSIGPLYRASCSGAEICNRTLAIKASLFKLSSCDSGPQRMSIGSHDSGPQRVSIGPSIGPHGAATGAATRVLGFLSIGPHGAATGAATRVHRVHILLVYQHNTDEAAGRSPCRLERFVPLLRPLAVEFEDFGRPAATLPGSLGQVDAVFSGEKSGTGPILIN